MQKHLLKDSAISQNTRNRHRPTRDIHEGQNSAHDYTIHMRIILKDMVCGVCKYPTVKKPFNPHLEILNVLFINK